MQPSAEATSHCDIVIEALSDEDLKIQEEVPRSKPDTAVEGWREGPEIHDEALVVEYSRGSGL